MIYLFIILLITLFFIYICSKKISENFNPDDGNIIPRIIIQTWKDDNPPEKYYKDIDSFRVKNPDFYFLHFDDKKIEQFLKKNYRDYYETYKKLPIKIQKIDFFRYIAIYHFGGFYFDLDMFCLNSLDPLLKYEAVFPVDLILTDDHCKIKYRNYDEYCKKGIRKFIGQYAFAAIQYHPFIKTLIDGIHNNIDKIVRDKSDDIVYVYKTTGPDYVTDKYYAFKNKKSIHILNYKVEQYFGKYAVHNMYGTWK